MIGQTILTSDWLQAYLDKMGVPFTFSGVEETRTAFNKHETVDLLREEGLPVVKSVLVSMIIITCISHHAWRDLNLKVFTNERDPYQACLFTQWSAKLWVLEIIEGKIWHNCKYLR